jgi:Flp pilus assembly protein TadD
MALIALILRLGWQQIALPAADPPLEREWVAACMAAVSAQLVGNLFLFEVAATSVVFWLLLAMVTGVTLNQAPQQAVLRPVSPRLGKIVLAVAVLIVGWMVWQGNGRPLSADIHSWRGTQALNQGNPAAALLAYTKSAEIQPQRAEYHIAVALTAAQLGRFDEAERAMQAAIALRPRDPVVYTQLAAVYTWQAAASVEKTDLAYDAFEQAIALAPTIALTNRQYADLALRSGDGALALAQAQRAVDLDATDGIAFGILGWAQLQAGDLATAQGAFEQAVRWQPDSADFYLGLATVHYQQGDLTAAEQAVKHSLARDPTYAPTLALQLQLNNT